MTAIVAFMDDLMFLSRIREAARAQGLEVATARNVPDLLAACGRVPRLILMDLDSQRIPSSEALAALKADPASAAIPVVGFFSHVHAERGREARAAGCTRVLPRSAFVNELDGLLKDPPAQGT